VIRCDALVVGGGPAGSTCARVLRQAGWDVIVADRARFPRDKVCAGWLTPEVFRLLELDPAEYRATGLTLQEITGFRTALIGGALIDTRYRQVVSYAIRRCEFDDFLLRRARVRVLDGTTVASLRRSDSRWIVNDAIDARVVIGAGGHFCPVARHLRGRADIPQPVVAKEAEFRIACVGSRVAGPMPELYFCQDLQGYGWCVRKGDYLNIGIGRRDSADFNRHVEDFTDYLEKTMNVRQPPDARWRGHAYLASGTGPRPLVGDGMLVAGDAAGLAYPESGEGIRPAIESGRLAAEMVIACGDRCDAADLQPYAQALSRMHPPAPPSSRRVRAASVALGRVLLTSALFTRHVVLNRWFLRR
jgi:menaquinone-9 beta-reductase